MGAKSPEFKPPKGMIPSLAERLGLASRWKRLAAAIVDMLVILPVIIGCHYLLVGATPWGIVQTVEGNVVVTLCSFGAYVLVNGFYLASNGQTIGKRLLRIRIVRRDGSPATLYRLVFLRILPIYVLHPIPVVGYWLQILNDLSIFGEDRRCIHDYIAKTIVADVAHAARGSEYDLIP